MHGDREPPFFFLIKKEFCFISFDISNRMLDNNYLLHFTEKLREFYFTKGSLRSTPDVLLARLFEGTRGYVKFYISRKSSLKFFIAYRFEIANIFLCRAGGYITCQSWVRNMFAKSQ